MTDAVSDPWDLARTRKTCGVYVPATGEFGGGRRRRDKARNRKHINK